MQQQIDHRQFWYQMTSVFNDTYMYNVFVFNFETRFCTIESSGQLSCDRTLSWFTSNLARLISEFLVLASFFNHLRRLS